MGSDARAAEAWKQLAPAVVFRCRQHSLTGSIPGTRDCIVSIRGVYEKLLEEISSIETADRSGAVLSDGLSDAGSVSKNDAYYALQQLSTDDGANNAVGTPIIFE